ALPRLCPQSQPVYPSEGVESPPDRSKTRVALPWAANARLTPPGLHERVVSWPEKASTSPESGWDTPTLGFARNVQNQGLMLRKLSLITLAAGLVLAVGYADQAKHMLTIPVDKTSPADGKQMFTSYCAP